MQPASRFGVRAHYLASGPVLLAPCMLELLAGVGSWSPICTQDILILYFIISFLRKPRACIMQDDQGVYAS